MQASHACLSLGWPTCGILWRQLHHANESQEDAVPVPAQDQSLGHPILAILASPVLLYVIHSSWPASFQAQLNLTFGTLAPSSVSQTPFFPSNSSPQMVLLSPSSSCTARPLMPFSQAVATHGPSLYLRHWPHLGPVEISRFPQLWQSLQQYLSTF